MPRAVVPQTNVTAGELTPLLHGRVDLSKFFNAGQEIVNFRPRTQGACSRRPGTYHVAETETMTEMSRLQRFEFSVTQAYILEFGNLYMRIYMDRGQVEDPPGTPVEVVTPWAEADLFQLKFSQSADLLYVTHPDYQTRVITRTSHIAWTLALFASKDGPFLPTNVSTTTLVLSGTSGSVTVTASAITGINGGTGFQTTDIGRLIRWKDPANNWTWLKITARTSTTVVTATVSGPNASAGTATDDWRLGMWSDTTGWPSCSTFFQDRLCLAGSTDSPQSIAMSRTGDYTNFAPTQPDGTVVDDNGIVITLNSSDVNVIRWMADDEKGLLVGTVGGEWIVKASSSGEAITPTNVQATRATNYGSANIEPVRAGPAVLYPQRARRKVREMAYSFEADGFRSPDMTLLAEHITGSGITQMAYQKEPDSIVWSVRDDGVLLSLAYEREQDVVGWCRHIIGGVSDADGTAAKVESVAVIPSPDGSTEDVWLIVQRWIDGAVKRYVEWITPTLDDALIAKADGIYMDSALTYSGAAAATITGLDHLEGETVRILADGAAHPDKEVIAGAVDLDYEVTKAQIGLPQTARFKSMTLEAGAADGTAQGRTKRIDRVTLRLYRSLGGTAIGTNGVREPIRATNFRSPATPMDTAPDLFTGDAQIDWPGGYETDGAMTFETADQFPFTFSLIAPYVRTYDR